ncbi:MAG: CehA/McbA family metallohydrolase [Vicinamibacteria bacterium]
MSEASPKSPYRKPGPFGWLLRVFAVIGVLLWLRACVAAPAALSSGVTTFGPPHRLSGVVHIHTNLSDGHGTPAEVVAAGARSKADFIVVTDHNRVDQDIFDALPRNEGDPLVIVGSEISTEAGHVLAIGIRAPTFKFSGTLHEVLDDIRALGGCAFAAHPMSLRGETRFTREDDPGSFGIEVVNGDSAWREASVPSLALAAWTYPANSSYALRKTLGTFGAERALWDRVLARRFAPGVGGTDAHGRIPVTRTSSLPVPSYDSLFGLVRTVVQLEETLPQSASAARTAITGAICAGHSIIAIPSLADPKGFSFVAQTPGGASFGPGFTVPYDPSVRLRVGGPMPVGTTLRLLEDGTEVASAKDQLEYTPTRPGVFRVEAYVPGELTPWVLSNPISLLTPALVLTRSRASVPAQDPYTQGTTEIDRFEAITHFAAEHDPGSRVDEPILDPKGGRGSGGAALLSFQLNPKQAPPVWCALVDRTKRDLSRNRGISFWMRADGEYRVWFQIRDQNKASADEGTEAWFASVRTSSAWTLYNIPFASLRSINKTTDGSFDPSKIEHIVFVIDHGAMPYGSKGKIWIDDLMAY